MNLIRYSLTGISLFLSLGCFAQTRKIDSSDVTVAYLLPQDVGNVIKR